MPKMMYDDSISAFIIIVCRNIGIRIRDLNLLENAQYIVHSTMYTLYLSLHVSHFINILERISLYLFSVI